MKRTIRIASLAFISIAACGGRDLAPAPGEGAPTADDDEARAFVGRRDERDSS